MLLIDTLITISPIIAYYSQYSLIMQKQQIGSFSIDVCFILIFANIMRILFWFCHDFAFNLFLQSFLVIAMQFFLLDACLKVGYWKQAKVQEQNEENKGMLGKFWRWRKLENFIFASGIYAVGMSLFTILCQNLQVHSFGPTLGLLSLTLQATLGIPQLLQNHKSKSVAGLSLFMIFCWFVGDFVKTMYFVVEVQPFQFILSGSFQLAIDTLIVIQVMAYGNNDKKQGYRDVGKGDYEIQPYANQK